MIRASITTFLPMQPWCTPQHMQPCTVMYTVYSCACTIPQYMHDTMTYAAARATTRSPLAEARGLRRGDGPPLSTQGLVLRTPARAYMHICFLYLPYIPIYAYIRYIYIPYTESACAGIHVTYTLCAAAKGDAQELWCSSGLITSTSTHACIMTQVWHIYMARRYGRTALARARSCCALHRGAAPAVFRRPH